MRFSHLWKKKEKERFDFIKKWKREEDEIYVRDQQSARNIRS